MFNKDFIKKLLGILISVLSVSYVIIIVGYFFSNCSFYEFMDNFDNAP